ncbi:hypothetical protein [Schaalia suimastitidis]|uniref:hypothetical protein n=1 Tax=Schaalia suimastitidis TaxID=121163 RepID=UPI0004279FBF|nr:hypothetical protein [Schaalia suimastitidis]
MARPAQFILTAAAATLLAATLPAHAAMADTGQDLSISVPKLTMSLGHEGTLISDGTQHDASVGKPYRIVVTLTNSSEDNLDNVLVNSLNAQGLEVRVERCDIFEDPLTKPSGIRLERNNSYTNCSFNVTAKEAGVKVITVAAGGMVSEKDTPATGTASATVNFKAAENTNPGTDPNTQPEDPKKPDVNPSDPTPQDPKDTPKPEDPKTETPKPQDPKDTPKPQDPKDQDPKTEKPKPLDPKMQDPQAKPQAPAGDAPAQPRKPEVTQNGAQPGVPPQGGNQGAKTNAPQGAGKLAKTGVNTPLAATVLIAGLGGAALLGRRLATK